MITAPDPVDRLLLDEAAAYASGATVVVDDLAGALVVGLGSEAGGTGPVRAYADSLLAERDVVAAAAEAGVGVTVVDALTPELVRGAQRVVARLPKSLAALDELAGLVAAYAAPDVALLAGGRIKHMSRGMNDVLAAHFGDVRASLGRQKSRVLLASKPLGTDAEPYPRREEHADLDVTVCAYGGVFAGTGVDLGTRFLLEQRARWPRHARDVVDLGCGSGLLSVVAARTLYSAAVLGLDESSAAVRSTTATAAENGVAEQVRAERADGLETVEERSLDLILCNPPFHRGNAQDDSTARRLFRQAGTRLKPGGELWVVWNSHLPYLPALRQSVGSTTVIAQNPRFTVTRSTRAATA